jgi:photosystem II stability/assembly factor-like uncharacterized protein
VAYAGSRQAIHRSDDGGQTWQRFGRSDGTWGPPGIIAGMPIDMQCDPDDPMRIFVNNYLGGNFLSTDGGQSWVSASEGYTGAQIGEVHVVPEMPSHIYAGGRSGLFSSQDGGQTWTGLANPGPGITGADMNEVLSMALDPSDPLHLMAVAEAGTIHSADGGQSWQMTTGLDESAPDIAFAPSDSDLVYAAVVPEECGDLLAAPADQSQCDQPEAGLYVSMNGGLAWSPAGGSQPLGKAMVSLAVHPTNAQIVYAGTFIHGVLKSTDGGQTWTSGTGLPGGATVLSLAISTTDPDILFAGLGEGGIYRSVNGGESWTDASAGLNPGAHIKSVVVDPTGSQIVYAADHRSGVYVSTNGGDSWQPLDDGLVHKTAHALTLSGDGTVLYLGTWGDGVYRLGTTQTERTYGIYLPVLLRQAGR